VHADAGRLGVLFAFWDLGGSKEEEEEEKEEEENPRVNSMPFE
jgi:hypothetical protein